MKVSGCCIVRDALKHEYPVLEAVKSILPLCDEFFIGVGKSDDGTLDLVRSLPGVTPFESEWDDSLREGGRVLSIETNKALERCSGDWIFCIQADEVVHERTLPAIEAAMHECLDRPEVHGLLFDYIHFYGSYSVQERSFAWYPHEVRVIKRGRGITSHGDAKGFRLNGKKLAVVHSGGLIHHYGWVRSPAKMLEKTRAFYRFWHQDDSIERRFGRWKEYPLWDDLSTLGVFTATHPEVMKERILDSRLSDCPEALKKKSKFRELRLAASNHFYRMGIRGSKNYRLVAPRAPGEQG